MPWADLSDTVTADEKSCLDEVRYLLGYLPSNNMEEPPRQLSGDDPDRPTPELAQLIPPSPNQPYDVHEVIETIVDDGDFLETQPLFAPNIVVGFGRVEGRSVGIIANQPSAMAGTLNIDAGKKASRFVRFCDAFSIPILTLVDVPGYLPGTDQEWTGVIRRGAKLLYAYAEATVPKPEPGDSAQIKSREIASGLAFPEGPVAMADGSVLVAEVAAGGCAAGPVL